VPMSKDSMALLEKRLRGSQVLRRKVQSIQRRGHLVGVTVPEIRKALKRFEFDHAKVLVKGEIALTDDNVIAVVQMLNEDLFEGHFSDERFAAGRKSIRS
jgi:ribosome-interacting GTPase 1